MDTRMTSSGEPDMTLVNSYRSGPDARGRFGIYGGRFVAETLMPLILELEQAYEAAQGRPRVPGRARRAGLPTTSAGRARSTSPSA